MIQRNVPDTPAPTYPPQCWRLGILDFTADAASARLAASEKTIVEWPSEKKKPVPSELFPSWRNLRVVLSIAAMWSASKAWRSPNVYASVPRPASAGLARE